MSRPVVAVFAMPWFGHFQRLRPLVAGLVDVGLDVVVLTHERFREDVEAVDARFFDLFGPYPFDSVDTDSAPPPVRLVSYAGAYAAEIVRDVRALRPRLVVYDSFAVIGKVVGRVLGLPYVNVCNGHDFRPEQARLSYERDPRLSISPRCRAAVATLRESFGLAEMTPLSFADALSPFLNVYCEPPEFLSAEAIATFEPVAFYGSLLAGEGQLEAPAVPGRRGFTSGGAPRRVYMSLGSYVWGEFHHDALRAVSAVIDALAGRDDLEGLVSLGWDVEEATLQSLTRPNVVVERWVDQRAVLDEADVFVTHHGLNSTHEAIDQRVPMLSCPVFGDQPAQAELCQSFGIAVPLTRGRHDPFTAADVTVALAQLEGQRATMIERLEAARGWEQAVISARGDVDRQIAMLAGA